MGIDQCLLSNIIFIIVSISSHFPRPFNAEHCVMLSKGSCDSQASERDQVMSSISSRLLLKILCFIIHSEYTTKGHNPLSSQCIWGRKKVWGNFSLSLSTFSNPLSTPSASLSDCHRCYFSNNFAYICVLIHRSPFIIQNVCRQVEIYDKCEINYLFMLLSVCRTPLILIIVLF